jgi:hypothetical protein
MLTVVSEKLSAFIISVITAMMETLRSSETSVNCLCHLSFGFALNKGGLVHARAICDEDLLLFT